MNILILNPNTSKHITERMVSVAKPLLPASWSVTGLTAGNGPKVVNDPSKVEQATQTIQEMARAGMNECDGIIIGISLDCALEEIRAVSSVPVVGMTEAACLMACAQTRRFGVLTLGAAMATSYEKLVDDRGLASRSIGVEAPDLGKAFEPSGALVDESIAEVLTHSARQLVSRGAQSVVLAGAVLCGYAPVLSRRLNVPVFDGASSAALLMRSLKLVVV